MTDPSRFFADLAVDADDIGPPQCEDKEGQLVSVIHVSNVDGPVVLHAMQPQAISRLWDQEPPVVIVGADSRDLLSRIGPVVDVMGPEEVVRISWLAVPVRNHDW